MYWTVFLKNIEDINSVKKILSELKSDNATKVNTGLLIKELRLPLPKNDEDIRRSLHRLGCELFEDYLKICKTDKDNENILKDIYEIEDGYKKIREKNHAFEISMLDITGRDLMDMGIQKGPEIGDILEYLLKKVIKSPELNNKDSLMVLVKEKFLRKS